LRELVDADILWKDIPKTQIKLAQLGNEAGIIGAAMICK
jgi:hypothetical protein